MWCDVPLKVFPKKTKKNGCVALHNFIYDNLHLHPTITNMCLVLDRSSSSWVASNVYLFFFLGHNTASEESLLNTAASI